MSKQMRLTISLLCAIAVGILLLLLVFFALSGAHFSISTLPTAPLDGLLLQSQGEQERIYSVRLPEDFDAPQSILFKSTHTIVEVSVNGETLYRFDREGNPSFLRSPGAVWHIVDLPANSAGGTLNISLSAVYDGYYGNNPSLLYGSHDGCALSLLASGLPIAIIDCIILFAGALCILLHIAGQLRHKGAGTHSFLMVGLFSFLIAAWSLCQSGILQLLIADGPTLYLIDFFSFNLFPVPFNLFLAGICKTERQERVFHLLSLSYLLTMAATTVLQLLGVVDMFRLMPITHAVMAVNVVCVFIGIRQEIREVNNDFARKFRLPLYVVMSFALSELVVYYINNFRQTSIFLPLGTIIFIVMLIWNLVAQYYASILEEQKTAYFKKLANTDMLTEVFNRNAYENSLKRLEQQEMELLSTCVALFDVDNLKLINDHYGHEKGDEALRCCCHCILQAFGPEGSCFRIGGDEFVYMSNRGAALEQASARFTELVRQTAQHLDFPFSVSMGYAVYDPRVDHALRDVIRRSDEMMYRNKAHKAQFVMPDDLTSASSVPAHH